MEFSSDEEMQKASREAQEFFALILPDEQPLFVSDEATIWDVSTSTSDEILARCSKYYSKNLSVEDLKQPLWKLLQKLNEGRQTRYKWPRISRLFALIRGKISCLP